MVAVITVDKLTKRYDGGEKPAVRNVSFTVADREFLVLLGPSGCGKSTVLRMIAGLEPISDGTISIDGRVVNNVPAKARDIAMVFQSYALYPHMTVFNNLAFGLRRRGIASQQIESRVRNVAERLGLGELLGRKPHALSGGQRQRVALGRAIVRDPKVFLFDEPLSNLDAALRASTRNDLIRQQREIGTTSIYVTHDQVEAMTMGDRICIMNHGEMVQVGRPLEVYRRPANTFVARFLGNPPMNLLNGRLTNVGGRLGVDIAGHRIALDRHWNWLADTRDDRDVIVGVRPEDLYEQANDRREMQRLPARVNSIETLGAETMLLMAIEGSGEEIVARVGRDTHLSPGAKTDVLLDPAGLHLFDKTTTKAITQEGGSSP
jgi:multiple sugar transport system ATP-binding protein